MLKLDEIDCVEDLEEIFDARYVMKDDCQRKQDETYKSVTLLQVEAAKIGTKLNIIVAILGAIGGALVAAVIALIFGG